MPRTASKQENFALKNGGQVTTFEDIFCNKIMTPTVRFSFCFICQVFHAFRCYEISCHHFARKESFFCLFFITLADHIWPPILEWIKQICQDSLPISIKKIFCILSLFMKQFKECPYVCMLGGKLFEMQCIYWWLNLISNWHTITSWNRSSFAHGRCGSNFRNIILRLIIQNSSLGTQCEIAFMWMTSPLKIKICSGYDLVLLGNKPLPKPFFSQIFVAIWPH